MRTAADGISRPHFHKAAAFTAHAVDKAVALCAYFKTFSVQRFVSLFLFGNKSDILLYVLKRFGTHLAQQASFTDVHARIISVALQGGSVNVIPLSLLVTPSNSAIVTFSGSSKVL